MSNKKKTYKTKLVNIIRLAKFYEEVSKKKANTIILNNK